MVIHFRLRVKVCKPWDGGEHDTDGVIGLRIQLLHRDTQRDSQKRSSEVRLCRDAPVCTLTCTHAQVPTERTEQGL